MARKIIYPDATFSLNVNPSSELTTGYLYVDDL
jgi:hypothetical protein